MFYLISGKRQVCWTYFVTFRLWRRSSILNCTANRSYRWICSV